MPLRSRGYTFLELLVVLAIVGMLSLTAGYYLFQPRQRPAVLSALSEIEALITEAHKYSSATLGTVRINATGAWAGRSFELNFQSLPPVGPPSATVNRFGAASFKEWQAAGVDDAGAMALTVGADTLEVAVSKMSADVQAELTTALANPLVGTKSVQINPFNKQFLTPFCIPVVGLRSGAPYAGAPAGMVVVTGNRIYKFYKSGPGSENPWRRL